MEFQSATLWMGEVVDRTIVFCPFDFNGVKPASTLTHKVFMRIIDCLLIGYNTKPNIFLKWERFVDSGSSFLLNQA